MAEGYLLIGSAAFGENLISLTVPLCPGSLYSSFLVSTSHTATLPSPPPAPTLSPPGDQLALMRFFSIPDEAPSYLWQRLAMVVSGTIVVRLTYLSIY
jgi:hypothetical protein